MYFKKCILKKIDNIYLKNMHDNNNNYNYHKNDSYS
jgi:hypothetical protein